MIIEGLRKQKELQYVGLSTQGPQTEALVKLLAGKKSAFALNNRNSLHTDNSMNFLCDRIEKNDTHLTALSLKFCFVSFEHVLKLEKALRFNHSIVKLDLSNNGLKSCVAKFLLEAIFSNNHLSDVNFHGNFLDNDFAF